MKAALFGEFPEFDIPLGSVVLDLGANRGRFSQLMAKRGAHVLAFEPLPVAAQAAERTLAKYPNAFVYRVAVGAEFAFAPIFTHQHAAHDPLGYSISASLLPEKRNVDAGSGSDVIVVPLSSILDAFDEIGLLKVDIEGSELSVWPTIRDNAAKIRHVLMELHDISDAHRDLKREIDAFIFRHGLSGAWSTNWI